MKVKPPMPKNARWQFWIDVGGTFTDCIAQSPTGETLQTKVLNTIRDDGVAAPVVAMQQLIGSAEDRSLPVCDVRLGTTRGTNALLTRTGARTAFATTKGFGDLLHIGDQSRPKLFELNIAKNEPLFETSLEIDEKILADGTVERVPDVAVVRQQLDALRNEGIDSIAVCLMHGFRFPQHEKIVGQAAIEAGFAEVRMSHEVAPLIKIVPRSETTVLDAYLNPVIASYLDSVQQHLAPGSTLQLMTSSGGLVSRERFSGKDSVLSGPAGGVVAVANVGRSCGFRKVIGFDMGGTSTDVSRFDADSPVGFERDFETVKAGVRIMTPMLAIETVAAGGGSVCRFDGAKLVVGPESAGADPGPACYGRGGPLTVTDLNLFLGRINVEQFPFPLDGNATEKRIDELRTILSQHGFERSREQLSAGLLDIANQNMASAIESISVGKGYDPQDYALVSFGGAASQHACAVADRLKIKAVLDHPRSSLLSADGIRAAVPVAHAVHAVLKSLATPDKNSVVGSAVIDADELATICAALQNEAAAKLSDPNCLHRVVLNLRYRGTDPYISVPYLRIDLAQIKQDFETAHRREFGFVKQDAEIELVAVRAEASGSVENDSVALRNSTTTAITSEKTQPMFSGNAWTPASLFDRAKLKPGDLVSGPAIISSRLSTTVVDANWIAATLSDGTLLLQPISPDETQAGAETQAVDVERADPVTLEIFNQHFSSIAARMGLALQKTSVSVNVKERLDFSCAIFTGTGDLVVNAPHIPVHLGAMSETVRQVIAGNPNIAPGEVFVTNNPYAGGSHLPDVTVVSPVFVDDQNDAAVQPSFWVASRSHHSEIGGKSPGSMPPDATCLGEEGVLIDNFKLIDGDGVNRFAELEKILTAPPWPSRSPTENLADVAAQVAANRAGSQELLSLVEQHGQQNVIANMRFIQRAAETKARAAIAKLPDGLVRFEDSLDNGATIRVAIDKQNDELKIDFSGTDAVLTDNFNANAAIVASAVMYVVRLLIDDDIPLNEGVMQPVEIVLSNCFLNPQPASDPSASPPVVGGNVETSQRVVDVLIGALGIAAASQGTMNNWLMGNESFGYYETLGGGSGATSTAQGADAVHVHMTNTRLTDPEVLEVRYPVVLRQCSIRRRSGGAGANRGGDGMIREVEFRVPLTVSLLTNRRNCQPWGSEGGGAGQAGVNLLIGRDGPIVLPSCCQLDVQSGDRLRIETPGGGGAGIRREN